MAVTVSVVICTYNRVEMLKGCLTSLTCQTAPDGSFEIIVVDNNSSDDTASVVHEFLGSSNISYVTESIPGLSRARNKGLAVAKGHFVAFFDDDCLAPIDWVENALKLIISDSNLDGLGGPLFPFYTTPKPEWFEDRFIVLMGREEASFLNPNQSFLGGNMFWERNLLVSIGGFRSEFGLIGDDIKNIGLGEETDAFRRAWQVKPDARFLFSPEMRAKHWVAPWKISLSYRLKRLFSLGFYEYKISGSRSFFSRASYLSWVAFDSVKIFIKAALAVWRYSHWKKWGYCELAPLAINLGKIHCAVGFKLPRET
jgi:glycosyltransferase involved in cell wall biosynthesis